MLTNFESCETIFERVTQTPEWAQLQSDFNAAKVIFFIGNGGNMAVASHSAADVTRLTDKLALAPDGQSMLTSIANDHGYENIFQRWINLHGSALVEPVLVIGLSGSGNSKNVLSALHWANARYNFKTALISGQRSRALENTINEICFNCEYFHTAEIASLMAMYELVHGSGSKCPTIKSEIIRKQGTDA